MAAVVTGSADLRAGPEQRPRFAHVAVRLAEMHPVRADPLGQSHAVVDDECDVGVGADALKRLGQPSELMLAHVLDAQLERRD
jgi:hypothetical protein